MTYFLHIPKTAGSSLRQVVEANYRPDELEVIGVHWTNWLRSEQVRERLRGKPNIKALHGHFAFGLHEDLGEPSAEEARYVTFLRRPRARVVSGYFHLRRHPKNPLREVVEHMSLDEYLDSQLVLDADNGMVRRLSGVADGIGFGEVGESHLEQALSSLQSFFILAGTLERFDASLHLLAERLSWHRRHYTTERRGTNKDSYTPSEETLRRIDELNVYDARLYDAVDERLKEEIARSGFDQRRFDRANRLFSLSRAPFHAARKARRKLRAAGRKLFGGR